jgi:hypothetical protein
MMDKVMDEVWEDDTPTLGGIHPYIRPDPHKDWG